MARNSALLIIVALVTVIVIVALVWSDGGGGGGDVQAAALPSLPPTKTLPSFKDYPPGLNNAPDNVLTGITFHGPNPNGWLDNYGINNFVKWELDKSDTTLGPSPDVPNAPFVQTNNLCWYSRDFTGPHKPGTFAREEAQLAENIPDPI